MFAMILAAGLGTRLRPLTDQIPKPMLPIAGIPLIGHQLHALARAGVSDVIINLHHLKEQITAYVGTGKDFGVSVHYSEEPELLETGGAIRKVLDAFDKKPFWLLNGDIWTDFDFSTLPRTLPTGAAHLVLTPTPAYRQQGDFTWSDGLITARGNDYVYCGIACLQPDLFSGIDPGSHFSLRDTYFKLIDQQCLYAQIHPGVWHDIGSLDQYQALLQQYPNPAT